MTVALRKLRLHVAHCGLGKADGEETDRQFQCLGLPLTKHIQPSVLLSRVDLIETNWEIEKKKTVWCRFFGDAFNMAAAGTCVRSEDKENCLVSGDVLR